MVDSQVPETTERGPLHHHFAAAALTGILANPACQLPNPQAITAAIIAMAWAIADLMVDMQSESIQFIMKPSPKIVTPQ